MCLRLVLYMQLDVRELASGKVIYRGPVGGTVNNALHISKDPSGKQETPVARSGGMCHERVLTQTISLLLVRLLLASGTCTVKKAIPDAYAICAVVLGLVGH